MVWPYSVKICSNPVLKALDIEPLEQSVCVQEL